MQKANNSITEKILAKKKRFLYREELIVEAALKLLLKLGIDKVTVSAIAREAGIGKGTIYKHFLSKNEIFMRIVLNYETELDKKISEGIANNTSSSPDIAARTYFEFRLSRPALDRLVQQLEIRLENEEEVQTQFRQLQEVRASNVTELNKMVEELISAEILEDVPPSFHYLSYWALVQGAVELYFSPRIDYLSEDEKQNLLKHIMETGVTMGKRGHLPSDN